ncbi:MAG: hypothetical protein KA974_10555 [Saprospiraceae bacterium]|nr:hypothetical protein [Saprospiraceae bacterium]MBP7679772.1 hypothetical protein [Saprospiraceae bacterium]
MNLENKNQKIASTSLFFSRVSKYSLFAFGLVGISAAIGTIGYKYLGEISWIDSFYMACMILTGMGPVVELNSDTAKLFSSFYALYSGVLFLSVSAVFFTPIIHRILHTIHVEDKEE